jgi:hypothetical protein
MPSKRKDHATRYKMAWPPTLCVAVRAILDRRCWNVQPQCSLSFDTSWILEEGVCHDGGTLCYRIRNAFSNRRVFAQTGQDGRIGFGASNPASNASFFTDQFWAIKFVPASSPTRAPTSALTPFPRTRAPITQLPTVLPSASPTSAQPSRI